MTRHKWKRIHVKLEQDIEEGVLTMGEQLPTEPVLAAQFGVGRHSVRRAIEALARQGKVEVLQGRGTFVDVAPRLTYSIGKRTRLHRNLVPLGVEVTSQLLSADRVVAPGQVRRNLLLDQEAQVIQSQRITLANNKPVSFGSVFHCATRFADFVALRDTLGSTTLAYKKMGINDYIRADTEFYSRRPTAEEAQTLKQHPDIPVIVVHAVDAELDGTPISCSEVVWSSTRVTFKVSN